MQPSRLFVGLALCLSLLSLGPVLADDPAPPPGGPGAGPETQPKGPEVHKIYVPFRDLQKVFEKEGQGVFLPYSEFRSLWEKAYRLPDDPTHPPVNAAVRSASYAGVADGETVRFTAELEVEVLAKGWQRVPLNFGGVGIEEATIGGEPALLVPTDAGYDLVLEGLGRRTLNLVMRVGAPATGDTHVAHLSLPPVPLAKLSLRVPGPDTDVQVTPRLAGSTGATADGHSELIAFLGPVSKVDLSWRRRPDEGPKVDALVFAQETTDVLVDRGVVKTDFQATLSILRAPLETLTLVVPADAVVLYVDGQGIRTWERSADGTSIKVVLREPVKETWALRVGLERALAALPAEVGLPLVGVQGLEREAGFVRLRAAEGVKVDPRDVPGLIQVDIKDLPTPLQGAVVGKAFGWRHPARPGAVTAAVEALAPRLSAAVGNRVGIRPEGVAVVAQAVLTVERAGIFGVSFEIPEALEVISVTVQGAELDDWTRVALEPGQQTLRVAFRDRLLGVASVTVVGRLPLVLAEEEGKETTLELPLVRLKDAQHVRGYVAIHSDAAIDRRETARTGLTVLEGDVPPALEPPGLPEGGLPLALRFEHREGAVALSLALKRKAATVTGDVETALRLEPDRTKVAVTLRWRVEFRGVDTFRFRGPLSLATRVHVKAGLVGMDLLEPEPEPTPEGAPAGWKATRGTWTLKLAAPRQGLIEVPLTVDDRPETPLVAGATRSVEVPVFVPVEADAKPLPNTRHSASVQRDPLLEVAVGKIEKGEEIDVRELPRTLTSADAFLAVRSFDPEHAVTLQVTKHEYERVAEVVISHMHLDTVVPSSEKRGTTEAYLVVRNNDRQVLEMRLPGEALLRAVNVDGKAETPRKGQDGAYLIPLQSGKGKDQAFVVAFVYDHDVDRGGLLFENVRLVSPVFTNVTSDLLTWRVFTPKGSEREVVGFGGDLVPAEEHGSWALSLLDGTTGLLKRKPGGRPLDLRRLVQDIEKGSPFQIPHDGHAWLFSNRVGTGTVELVSVEPKAFLWFRLGLVFIGLVLGRLLVRLARGLGYGALPAFWIPALLLLALIVPAGTGKAAALTALLMGVLLSGVGSFFGWLARPRVKRAPAAQAPAETRAQPPPALPAEGGGA
jgi:hypothetical protein